MSKLGGLYLKLEQRGDKIPVTAYLSLTLNLAFSLFYGFLGVYNGSLWFGSLCAFYVALAFMRFSAVLCERKYPSQERKATVLSGLLLILSGFILSGIIYISVSEGIASKYETVIMITIATYTFFKVGLSVRNAAVARRKGGTPLMPFVIREVGYADAATAVLTLQRSMLASFEGMEADKIRIMNIMLGAVVCSFIFFLGVYVTLKGVFTRTSNAD